jgi:hypothetical protein
MSYLAITEMKTTNRHERFANAHRLHQANGACVLKQKDQTKEFAA